MLKGQDVRWAKPDSCFAAIAARSENTSAGRLIQIDPVSTTDIRDGPRTQRLAGRVNYRRSGLGLKPVDGITTARALKDENGMPASSKNDGRFSPAGGFVAGPRLRIPFLAMVAIVV